ncbi:MAG: hypothetical protein ACRDGN_05370, partial [bacterium]
MPEKSLTSTDILAAAGEILVSHGYSRSSDAVALGAPLRNTRLLEDAYGIVAVVVYETWEDLVTRWPDAQGFLVDLISKHVSSADAKAWEGYLVLLTPAVIGMASRSDADRIRYDTTRVRKLLATGEELRTVSDVERVLLPLLPLDEVEVGRHESTVEMLPELLTTE